ncbi:MAG: DMT family transporter [Pseudomonadota bacterium]|nr:DMT family transporter [Pseudomonadota bacterium]MEC7237002.1 DMT family transporter [Pseudomonadota bacterium]
MTDDSPCGMSAWRALALAVAASLFFAASTFTSKLLGSGFLGDPVHPLQVAHSRFAFGLITAGALFVMAGRRFQDPRANLHLHVLRSSLGWIGVGILFAGVVYIPASDAVALTFLNPIFAMIFATILLKERVGRHRWSAAALSFAGTLLLIRPEGGVHPMALVCILGAILIGLEITIIKLLSAREDVFQILVINNLIAVVIATVPLAWLFRMPTLAQWGALAAVGVIMVAGQTLFLFAMRAGEASLVAPFIYATLVFVVLMDLAVLGVVPDAVSLSGAGVIIACGSYIAMREHRQRRG